MSKKNVVIGLITILGLAGCTQTELNQAFNLINENINRPVYNVENWLTYDNEDYGLEFRYPESWEMVADSNKSKIDFFEGDALAENSSKKDLVYPELTIFFHSDISSPGDLVKEYIGIDENNDLDEQLAANKEVLKYGEIIIDGQEAKLFLLAGEVNSTYYFISSNKDIHKAIVLIVYGSKGWTDDWLKSISL